MQNSGKQVVMVTSGAVALGRQKVGNEISFKALKESDGKIKTDIPKVIMNTFKSFKYYFRLNHPYYFKLN